MSHNLPLAVDSFVGREHDMAELHDLLKRTRHVTLTGPPGVGKTRLAIESGTAHLAQYEGVWLVRLESVADPGPLAAEVAATFALQETPGSVLEEVVVAYLRSRRLLLILDNAEHLRVACALFVDKVLRTCAEVSVVVTSQQALGIAGERLWPVSVLPVPSAGDTGSLTGYAAARLFCDRAVAIDPCFVLDDVASPGVAEICRRLDGIPLAIELAAARVGVLAPAEIASRLGDRLSLLTGGSNAVMPRHHALKAALDWSHELLSQPERTLFRRLSVFVGGAPLEAIEASCTGPGVEATDVFDLLASLVAKSLVLATKADGIASRFSLLETIRAYAAWHLAEAGEGDHVSACHAAWCCSLAERAEPNLCGPEQRAWLAELSYSYGNITAALTWSIAARRSEPALRLTGALTLFWRVRGMYTQGLRFLTEALALRADAAPAVLAKALWGAGFLAVMVSDDAASGEFLEECDALWSALGDDQGRARSLLLLGNRSLVKDSPDAVPQFEQSIALARTAGDDWCLSHSLALAGVAHLRRGRVGEARAVLDECVVVAVRAGDDQGRSIGLLLLGDLALGQGEYDDAEKLLTEGLELTQRLGEPYGSAGALSGLAGVAAGRGCFNEARDLLDRALVLDRELCDPAQIANSLCRIGRVAWAEGNIDDARRHYREALDLVQENTLDCPPALLGLGRVAIETGDLDVATDLLQKALGLLSTGGHQSETADVLHELAIVATAQSTPDRAAALAFEALQLRQEVGHLPGVVESLELMAGLHAQAGRLQQSARLFAAAEAAREVHGYRRFPVRAPSFDADVARLRRLGDHDLEAARRQGSQMSVNDAVSHASKRRGTRSRPETGWGSLTKAERDVVALVVDGLTNSVIAERLFISKRTVESHLANVFPKLGVSSRTELAMEVSRHGATQGR